eukprot:116654_1
MGNCCQIDSTTRELDKRMKEEQQKEERTSKILFLGSGGGGKSTMFKQLGYIYNDSNTKFDPLLKTKIYTQIIEQMQTAIELCLNSKQTNNNNTKFTDSIITIQQHQQLTNLPINVANAIQYIWKNSEILQSLMKNMSFTQKVFEETTIYFWNELDRIKQPNYSPNRTDFLNLREKTTGISQRYFDINNRLFHIFDVGGQVSERKKWINCFDGVTAVIFVADLSCYNEVLYEDYYTNAMTDQLDLFDDICNCQSLKFVSMILFLNKKDIFEDKIKRVALSKCDSFKDYSGREDSYDETVKYISSKFNKLNSNPEEKYIFTHVTCATDYDNIQKVFVDVEHIVVDKGLNAAGF